MTSENYYNIIDFGSSKIRFAVLDNAFNEKYLNTISVNFNEDYTNQFDILLKTIKKAEKKFSFHIKDIILILDSSNLLTIEISLSKNLDKKTKFKKIYDSLILELNQLISTYYNTKHIVHIIMDNCIADHVTHKDLLKEEVKINNLKVDFKVICFSKELINSFKNNFIKNNLNVVNIFCTSYLKSKLYSKQFNKDKISFLDIGYERTTFTLFEEKKFKLIQTIPIGGFHITKDISNIFKISTDEAEKIKKLFNKSDTEFSYENNSLENSDIVKNIINKNISVDTLKQVILYRVQEIMDLVFKKIHKESYKYNINDTDLFLIGEGSILFNDNSFYLNDKFNFKSISFYAESDSQICSCGLLHHFSNNDNPKIIYKKQGLFEKFFNYFSK